MMNLVYLILSLTLAIVLARRYMLRKKVKTKSKAKLVNSFNKLVSQHRAAIENLDIMQGRIIAIDRINKKLFIIDHSGHKNQEECIPLVSLSRCSILEKKSDQEITEKIFLEFVFHDGSNELFCFYDHQTDDHTQFPLLSRKASNWKSRIEIHMKFGRKQVVAEYVL